jgi:hypothetical protein
MNTNCPQLKVGGERETHWYECEHGFQVGECMDSVPGEFKEKKEPTTPSKFTIKDSGERTEFSTGMMRDSCEKIRYDLIPIWFLERFAEHLTKGAKKYKPRNWELAETPEELDRFIQSLWRHIIAYLKGEVEEDHLSAAVFNLCGIEYVKQKLGPEWQTKLRNYQLGKEDK